ncbi:MAG: hypothetical protein ABFS46_15590 [Myxococcota bacterium]
MATKRHAIITACDARYGNFLARHWLRSLKENVDLEEIDVVVLDFGLEAAQRAQLEGAVLVPARREGRINVARRRETARFLEKTAYDQVLCVDGGDVIFQRDISPLFSLAKDRFRGVQERYPIPLGFFLRGAPRRLRRSVRTQLESRYMVNGGFILGPAKAMRDLGDAVVPHLAHFKHDQPIVTAYLYERGFEALDETYNLVLWTTRDRFFVDEGIFYRSSGEKVAVVHNTGRTAATRIVSDFGYGRGHNTRQRSPYLWVSAGYRKLVRG